MNNSFFAYFIGLFLLLFYCQISILAYETKDTNQVLEFNKKSLEIVYSNPNEALSYAKKALFISQKLKYRQGEASSLSRIGIYYDVIGKYDSAIIFYQKSLKFQQKTKNLKGIGASYSNLGLAYLNKGDYYNALRFFQAALSPLTSIKNYQFLGNCYNNIGLLYYELKVFDKSISNFKTAIIYYDSIKNTYQKANVLSNLSNLYSDLELIDTSIQLCKLASVIYVNNNDDYNAAKCLNNMGMLYIRKGNIKLAEKTLLESIKHNENSKNINGITDTYVNLAIFYKQHSQKQKSVLYYKKAFELLPLLTNPRIKSTLLSNLSELYYEEKNYQLAAKLMFESKRLKDSIFKEDVSNEIAKAEAQFGIQIKENENKILKQENKIQQLEIIQNEKKLKQRQNNIFFILIASILLIFISIIYFRKRQSITKLENEKRLKSEQNKQRTNISHELHDNVGAQLSYIVSNLEKIQNGNTDSKNIDNTLAMSKEAILTLRETVWALNNESIQIQDFSDKLKQYIKKIGNNYELIKIDFTENIEYNTTLNPLEALNLFRLCQEAFSNCIKHSQAEIITIELSNNIDNKYFNIKIYDNGKGFDTSYNFEGHYGLKNMLLRAKEINASIEFNSHHNQGTEIVIKLFTNK
ncbi:MAG: tetratricopeptide repeat protein [Bacteroidota bacterium]|nr:tetratricopeptide repeat protein [Bacteroidota bacterium]